MPGNLAAATCYGYMFLLNAPNFVGYLLSAVYYILMEYGFGDIFCLISGLLYKYSSYGYMAIDWIMELIPGEMTDPDDDQQDDVCAAFINEDEEEEAAEDEDEDDE